MTIPRARSAWYSPTHGATETVALAGLPLLFFAAMCHLYVVEGHLGHFHRVDRNLSPRGVKRARVPLPAETDSAACFARPRERQISRLPGRSRLQLRGNSQDLDGAAGRCDRWPS